MATGSGRGPRAARAAWPLFLSACVLLVNVAGAPAQDRPIRERTTYQDLQMFSQVLNQIRVNHPDEVESHDLFMAAVEGLIRAADPHSYVIPYERLSPEKQEALEKGDLVPVPIAFRSVGGALVVVSVHPASTAAALDILPGDELVAVDGDPVLSRSAPELDVFLAGPRGSSVVLELERRRLDGSLTRLERTVIRQRVESATAVPTAMLLDSTTGYIRITTFANENTADDFHDAMKRLEQMGMRRLVLDLRDNGGGLIEEAAEVAGEFLPRGTLLYTTEGRKEELIDTVRVGRSFLSSNRNYPVALLVNEGTASASELVVGALQDHDRALVVGRTTFGKALLMQPFPLTDGSLMVLVVGTVRTPCGRSIQRDYRSVSTRAYYRAQHRDRLGRPTCTSTAGRTLLGGGGITPDHVLEDDPAPVWLHHVREQDLLARWVPGFGEAHRERLARLRDDPRSALPDDATAAFREFAADEGVIIPGTDPADDRLAREILHDVAYAIGGAELLFRVIGRTDPHVAAAVRALDTDESLPR